MERFIAVDHVCAWPELTLLPDGRIIATIFNRPSHGRFEGDLECWLSTDGGFLWEKSGVPFPHEPGTNRMNVGVGLANDGSFIAICSGWGPVPPDGADEPEKYHRRVLESIVCRSYDAGRTWLRGRFVEKPQEAAGYMPFGTITRSREGLLGICFHSWGESWADETGSGTVGYPNFTSYFVRSYDDGKSWVEPVVIGRDTQGNPINNNETAVICPDGTSLLAAARTMDDQHLELYTSPDFGKTWQQKGPVTLPGQHPAHFCPLQDGSILLTYGIRNKPFCGIGARVSHDQGNSWSSPVFLVNLENVTDCGYPSSVQIEDGTIVTAYYAKNIPCHNRYHMGVVRWTLHEFF